MAGCSSQRWGWRGNSFTQRRKEDAKAQRGQNANDREQNAEGRGGWRGKGFLTEHTKVYRTRHGGQGPG